MRTIYIDSCNRCHITDDGTMTAVDTDTFDGKCAEYIEGYCYVIDDTGSVACYPWKPYDELDSVQRAYERRLLAEYAEALKVVGVNV